MRPHVQAAAIALALGAGVAIATGVGVLGGADAAAPRIIQARTTSLLNLGSGPGGSAVINTMTLPAGQWVVEGKATVFNPADADNILCTFKTAATVDSATVQLGTGGSLKSTVVNLAVVNGPASIMWSCTHDNGFGTPYIEPDAILVARKV